MSAPAVPPGWPTDLPPPYGDEFSERVVGWLLDRLPPSFREVQVWRSEPGALAMAAQHFCNHTTQSLRESYSAARRELTGTVAPHQIDALLAALEAGGADAVANEREVDLVAEALGGRQWRERL